MSSKETKAVLKEIREAIKNKNSSLAIEKCKEVLQCEPNNHMALILIGAAYQEIDKKEAAKHLRKAVACAPDPTIALQGLANCAEADELPGIYGQLLKLVPGKTAEYHQKLVAIAVNNKNLVKECTDILKSESEVSDDEDRKVSALKSLAIVFVRQTESPEVGDDLLRAALETVIPCKDSEIHLDSFKRYLKLLYKLKDFQHLVHSASEMSELYPSEVYPLEWICKLYCEHYKTAKLSFPSPIDSYVEKLLKLNPAAGLGLLIKAIKAIDEEQYVLARDYLLQVKIVQPNYPLALELLAKVHMQIGSYALAEEIFRQLNMRTVEFGECLSHSKSTESLKEAVQILEEFKDNILAMEALARSHHGLDNTTEVRNILENLRNKGNEDVAIILEAQYLQPPSDAVKKLETLNDQKYEVLFLQGKYFFEINDYDNSLMCVLKATRLRPYRSECFLSLGRIYSALKDFVRARKCFEKCVSLNPVDEFAVLHLSAIYKESEEWELNFALLQNSLKNFQGPESKIIVFQLGLHYFHVKKFDDAIRSFRSALRFDATNILYWEGLADSYMERGSFNSALKVYQKMLEIEPTNIYPKLQIAIVKSTIRMHLEAIDDFDALLSESPDYLPALKGAAEAHYWQANELLSQRLLGRCKSHLQSCVEYLQRVFITGQRDMVWLWRLTANTFVAVATMPTSLAYLEVSGKLAARDETLVRLDRKELFEFATKFYTCALKLSPEDTLLWYELALCSYHFAQKCPESEQSSIELALKACKLSIKYQPTRWQNWNLLGVLNATKAVNNLPLAQHCFIKTLQLDKKSYTVWTNLGVLYLKLNQIKLANKAFQRAQQSNPQYVNAWIGQALIAEHIGEEEEAMDLFRHCTQLDFHLESAVGYAHWVCSILSNPSKLKESRYKYAIENMHSVPLAWDSINWYVTEEDDESSAEALSYLGFLSSKQSLHKSAIVAYKRATEKCEGKTRDVIFCNLGYAFLKANQPDEAIKAFNSVTEATYKSTIGLALAYYRCNQHQESYSVYSSALEWLAQSDQEKANVLVAMSAMVYAFQGEADTKTILFQSISLQNSPVQALLSACALGILHKDQQLIETMLEELKAYENDLEHCHHVAYLTAQHHLANNQPRKGLTYLASRVHTLPQHPLLRKVLAEYLLENFGHMRKFYGATSQLALGAVELGLRSEKRNSSLEFAKSIFTASKAIANLDKLQSRKLLQCALHMHPTFKSAWSELLDVKS